MLMKKGNLISEDCESEGEESHVPLLGKDRRLLFLLLLMLFPFLRGGVTAVINPEQKIALSDKLEFNKFGS